ncbi:MAG: DUF3299 domain-containing protein [Bradymonadales bacterium]|nr:MAG: DUF3299 domain-containing protein [Bradymonadales bacterium]
MKETLLWLGILLLVGSVPFLLRFVGDSGDEPPLASETSALQWRELRQFQVSAEFDPPSFLKELDGQFVRIPGFVVPLEDDLQFVEEFILVPSAMACIHVPPPPPNQIVLVRLRSRMPTMQLIRPQWVTGRFRLLESESVFGGSYFLIEEASVEAYRSRGF